MYIMDVLLVTLLAAGAGWSICSLSGCCMRRLAVYKKDTSIFSKRKGIRKELVFLVISCILTVDLIWYGGYIRLHYIYGEEIDLVRKIQVFIPLSIGLPLYIDSKMHNGPMLEMDCVVQALNSVPVGIAFVNIKGVPVLINNKMYELNQILLGRYIPNFEMTWECWKKEGLQKYPVAEYKCGESELFFSIGEEVWRIRREFLDIGFWQIRAEEITNLYNLQNEIRKTLKTLAEENKKYADMIQSVININSEQKYLTLKMNLHREFGDCLQSGYRYMNKGEGMDKEKVLQIWKRLLDNLSGSISLPEKIDEKRELMELASLFNCKLYLTKQNWFREIDEPIFYFCVRESMMNAIRHGSATKVFVTQDIEEDKVRVCIRDNGTGLKEGFSEGGGISGIREYLKQKDIPMYLKAEEGRLEISFLLRR